LIEYGYFDQPKSPSSAELALTPFSLETSRKSTDDSLNKMKLPVIDYHTKRTTNAVENFEQGTLKVRDSNNDSNLNKVTIQLYEYRNNLMNQITQKHNAAKMLLEKHLIAIQQ
jgi:hypothetical protein